jgi:signal transduction histidine kinase
MPHNLKKISGEISIGVGIVQESRETEQKQSPALGLFEDTNDSGYLTSVAERIHDQPLQLVSAARICLHQLKRRENNPETDQLLDQADHLLAQSLVELRSLMHDAHPVGLKKQTLAEALRETANELQHVYGIECEMDAEEFDHSIELRFVDLAVRMVRESAINAYKHARSRQISIQITACNSGLRLVVTNTPAQDLSAALPEITGGFGLATLRRRAEAMGGYLKLHLSEGHLGDTACELYLPEVNQSRFTQNGVSK